MTSILGRPLLERESLAAPQGWPEIEGSPDHLGMEMEEMHLRRERSIEGRRGL